MPQLYDLPEKKLSGGGVSQANKTCLEPVTKPDLYEI
jgi:hypothetical protein